MNELIKIVRAQFPGEKRSDDALLLELGQVAETSRPEWFEQFPDFAQQYAQLKRDMRPSLGEELKGSIGAAVDNLQATTYGAGAMAADLVGADRLKVYLAEQAAEQERQAAEFAPSVGSYKDVGGFGDAAHYIAYALGQVIPSAAESAILALVGAAVGSATAGPGVGTAGGAATGLIAKTAIRNLMRAGIKDFVSETGKAALAKEARSVAARIGAQVGMAASTIPQSQGEIYNSVQDQEGGAGIAAAAGTLSGLLDLIPESYVLSRFFKPGAKVATAEANRVLAFTKRLAQEAAKTVPMEGSTEAAQEFINFAAEKYARGEPASITADDIERFTNAGIIGAIGGGMFAPAAALGGGRDMPAATPAAAQARQAAAEAEQTERTREREAAFPVVDTSFGPPSPARSSAEAMFAGEVDEAGVPISPDRATRRSDAGAAGLRADLFRERAQAEVAAAPALGEAEDVSGVTTPVDEFMAGAARARQPSEFDYIAKVREAVVAAQNAERQAAENEAILRQLNPSAVAPDARTVEIGRAMMGDTPEIREQQRIEELGRAMMNVPGTFIPAPAPQVSPQPAISQEPVAPVVAEVPSAAALETATQAPATTSVPESAPVPTAPAATQPGQLAGLTFIRDFRNEPLNADERVAEAKTVASQNMANSEGHIVILDRGTGRVHLRPFYKGRGGKWMVGFAQRRGADRGVAGAKRIVDFDAATEGTVVSGLLNTTLPDFSPRYEIVGYGRSAKPGASVSLTFNSIEEFDGNPEAAELVKQGFSTVDMNKRAPGRRPKSAGKVSFDQVEGLVSDDERASESIVQEGSVEAETAAADTDAEIQTMAVRRATEAEPIAEPAVSFEHGSRAIVKEAAQAIADGEPDQGVRNLISAELTKLGVTDAAVEKRAGALGVKSVKSAVDVIFNYAKVLSEEIGRLNTVRANSPFRLPESQRIALFDNLVRAIRASGGDVVAFQQALEAQFAPWAQANGFQLTQADGRSLIGVSLNALQNQGGDPVVILLHEAGHHFLEKLVPDPVMRIRYQDALARMPWNQQRWLMNPLSTDLRLIANADPATLSEPQKQILGALPPDQLEKLRATDPTVLLVEQAAEHLAMLGASRPQARSVIDQIVRAVKDLLLRAAIAIQQTLKGQNAVSERLVRQYVENRWLQFINRDFALGPMALASIRNWIGAPSTQRERIAVYANIGGGDPRVGELDPQTGEIYPTNFVPEDVNALTDKLASANFTVRSIDQSIRYTPAVQVNSEFAVINFIDEALSEIYGRVAPILPKAVLESEDPQAAFYKKYLAMRDTSHPRVMREALRGTALRMTDPLTNARVPFIDTTKIRDLVPTTETVTDIDGRKRIVELNSAQDYAIQGSLSRLYAIMGRVEKNLATSREQFERLEKRKNLSEEDLNRKTELGEKIALLERVLNEPDAGLRWRIGDLESRIQGATPDVFYPGAEYLVPGNPKSAPSAFSSRKLPRDLRFSPRQEQEFISALASMRAWLDEADNLKYGREYGRMLNQWKRLSENYSTTYTYSAVTANMRKSFLTSLTEKFRAIGTPDAKQASKQIYRFQELVMQHQNDAKIHGARWAEAYQRLIAAMGRRNDEAFKEQVWDVMSRTFEQINEGAANAVEIARSVLAKRGIEFKSKAQLDAFRDLVRVSRDGQRWRKQVFEELGLSVEDAGLETPDGKKLQRRLLAIGYFNGQRHASRLINSLYLSMSPTWSSTDGGDAHPLSSLGQLLGSNEAAARTLVSGMFNDAVIRDFVEPLIENNAPFITLRDQYGIVGTANQNNVQAAWSRANGDVVQFARELHRIEAREDVAEAQTINDVMNSFLGMYGQIKTEAEARNAAEANGIEVLPRQMMDGRQADNWPAEWVSYSRYDDTSNFVFLMQSALNSAFGRNGFGAGGEFSALLGRIRENISLLRDTESNLRKSGLSPDEIRRRMGADEYTIALQADDHLYMLGQAEGHKMSAITKTTGYLLADMRVMTDIIHMQAGMMLQQPKSAGLQLFDVLAPLWKTKFSTVSLNAVKQAFATVFSDAANSLGGALGSDLSLNSAAAIRRRDAGIKDPDNYISWKQKVAAAQTRFSEPDRPERSTERLGRQMSVAIRAMRELMNAGRNDVMPNSAPAALSPKFRPFGIFSATSQSVTNGLVDALYTNMSDLAIRGVEFIERAGGAAAQEQFVRRLETGQAKLDPRDLGYVRKWMIFNDRAAFDYLSDALTTKMSERSIEDFVAKAWRRMKAANGAPWEAVTARQMVGIANIATSEYSLQANAVSTPIDMLTHPMLRMASVFLIWPWNAMIRSASSFRDAQGRLTKESVLDGTTVVLMGAIPAALAGSLLVDLYDEKVVGKRSNLRELDPTSIIPGVGPILEPMAVLERLARYGTFGLASEAVNGILNFDDARGGFSADNRIFIFNQFNTMRYMIGNLWQQEGEVTYQSVGRPLLQFMGMNGVLQYTQIANKQLGLNNTEAAINERINASNYLRASGRALDLDVRVMKGAQSIPTPVTPYIQQMELGAITGNYGLFREGYAHAIQQAAREGKEDPVKYVREAFAARHPLRRIFRTLPSEAEYRRLLSSLNEDGRRAVAQAVTSYNSHLERLHLKPVAGRRDTDPTPALKPAMTLEQARALAAEAAFGASIYGAP